MPEDSTTPPESSGLVPVKDTAELRPLRPAENYSGQLSRQLAIEMLERAIRYIRHNEPPSSWSDFDKGAWYMSIAAAVETLSTKVASLRPNIREVLLPQPFPDEPGSSLRQFEYAESATGACEVLQQILEAAGRECGKDFQQRMKLGIVKWLRRKDESRLAKPDKKVNLEMIRILRTFEEAHTGGKEEPLLKELAPESEEPDRWAQYVSIQLKRFCERTWRVWKQWSSLFPDSMTPGQKIDQIWCIPNARAAFLDECSLEFSFDAGVATEAIRRHEELIEKHTQTKQRKALKRRSSKAVRQN